MMDFQRHLFPAHDDELVIDNFAGGGGASTGISRAIGRSVDVAINHDPLALAMHEANHPETRHYCENILDVDPVQVCGGRPVGMAWFSPDCTHHSKAKGGKPRKKEIRALAWIVVRWAAKVRPRVIFLENVEEFQDWGPLKDGQPVRWPKVTHGPGRGLKPYRTAAECLDWSIPCPSIFLSKEEAQALRVIRPLAENTLKRIAKGIQRFVLDNPAPFIVTLSHGSERFRGQSLEEPLRTITAIKQHALVSPYLVGIDNKSSGASGAWGPKDQVRTITTENRFAMVAPTLVQTGYGEREGQAPRCLDLKKPLGTVVAGGGKHAMVAAFLAKHYGGVVGHGVERPLGTIATVDHHSLVKAFLVKYYGAGIGQACGEPLHTIPTVDRFGLVTVAGEDYQIADIGLRMLQPRELAKAQGLPDDYVLPGTKTQQVRAIGNSVSPPPAEALVRANFRAVAMAGIGVSA